MRYHKMKACQETGQYIMESKVLSAEDILTMANQLSRKRLAKGMPMRCVKQVKGHVQNLLQDYEHEVFAVLLLDNQLRIIAFKELFRGTINQATVYPRELAKLALKHNAASVILAHNHPSGNPNPSQADIHLTSELKKALHLVDVSIIDHIVVAKEGCRSLAQMGHL